MTDEQNKEPQALVAYDALVQRAKETATDADKANPFISIPRIEINNQSPEQEVKLANGQTKKQPILCDPEFIEVMGKDEDYAKIPFAPEFDGVLLTTTYQITRKGDAESISNHPFFFSYEFDTYNGEPVVLRRGEEESDPMSWKDFSANYKGHYVRWTLAYVLINKAIYKLALKPVSGRILNKYKNSFEKDNDFFLFHNTKFGLETDTTGKISYHKVKCESIGKVENPQEMFDMRVELVSTIKMINTPKKVRPEGEESVAPEKSKEDTVQEAPLLTNSFKNVDSVTRQN